MEAALFFVGSWPGPLGLALDHHDHDHDHDDDDDHDQDDDRHDDDDDDGDVDKKLPCVRQCAASGGLFSGKKTSEMYKTLVLDQ